MQFKILRHPSPCVGRSLAHEAKDMLWCELNAQCRLQCAEAECTQVATAASRPHALEARGGAAVGAQAG